MHVPFSAWYAPEQMGALVSCQRHMHSLGLSRTSWSRPAADVTCLALAVTTDSQSVASYEAEPAIAAAVATDWESVVTARARQVTSAAGLDQEVLLSPRLCMCRWHDTKAPNVANAFSGVRRAAADPMPPPMPLLSACWPSWCLILLAADSIVFFGGGGGGWGAQCPRTWPVNTLKCASSFAGTFATGSGWRLGRERSSGHCHSHRSGQHLLCKKEPFSYCLPAKQCACQTACQAACQP